MNGCKYWRDWSSDARTREPVFVDAMDHHEMGLHLPGIDIIERTDPGRPQGRHSGGGAA